MMEHVEEVDFDVSSTVLLMKRLMTWTVWCVPVKNTRKGKRKRKGGRGRGIWADIKGLANLGD